MTPILKMQALLDLHPEYRSLLFRRGYLITDAENLDLNAYPFYGSWNEQEMGRFGERNLRLLIHGNETVYISDEGGICILIIGHAYNPFTMQANEDSILNELRQAWVESREHFLNKVSELTGIHLIVVRTDQELLAVQDASGLKSCYYGMVENQIYITQHPQLVGDLCDLKMDPMVAELVATKTYNIGNRYLPGNMSPFKELFRMGGNTFLEYEKDSFRVERFFPVMPQRQAEEKQEVIAGVKEVADLLSRNLELVTQKWKRPAISLTGGTDSKTTLASASDFYDRFQYFSFHSKPTEVLDAAGAGEVCDALGLDHVIYPIPSLNEEVSHYDLLKKIVDHNTGYFKNMADNEVRKMIFLEALDDFDVEVKSWASETVRVFMERKYRMRMPVQLTPRHFSIFQTRDFGTPALLRQSDKIYAQFIKDIHFDEASELYEAADLYYWEVRMGAWGASVVSALDFCHEVTIPYNNRKLLELFLTLPKEMRKTDAAHGAIMALREPRIRTTGVEIRNRYFHSNRQILEAVYYLYRTVPQTIAEKTKRMVLGLVRRKARANF